jgi:hypothetical protein
MTDVKIPRARIVRAAKNVENIPVLVEVPDLQEGEEGQPQAFLRDLGEKGMQIEVICTCGKKIVLECTTEVEDE